MAATIALVIAAVFVGHTFSSKKAAEGLDAATISVWFSVPDGASEKEAMESVFEDFQAKFQDVKIDYRAIPAEEYEGVLSAAARSNQLPNLFESTGLSDEVLNKAIDLDSVLDSPQFKECIFLDQYSQYYSTKKQVPIGIEIPVAYVITRSEERRVGKECL